MGLFDALRRLFGGPSEHESHRDRDRRVRSARAAPPPRPARGFLDAPGDESRQRSLGVPVLADPDALARAMGIERTALEWLADRRRLAARRGSHYRPIVRRKRDGSARVLLAPKPRLKAAQRWILRNVLDALEVSPEAHGFVRRRSIVTNATPHVGQAVVLKLDLRDFFHQFSLRHGRGFFRSLGYSGEVSDTLACLTTAPLRPSLAHWSKELGMRRDELADALRPGRRWRGMVPTLPQGAPTSPALANLLCRRLDRRLAGLARSFRAQYTRYADDLTFSGGAEFRRDLRRFVPLVRRILAEHRLPMNHAKRRFARQGSRQKITGLVVNDRVSVPAVERRRLRAILHNAGKTGLDAQNREGRDDFRAHLRGRVAFVEHVHPEEGKRLREVLAGVTD